MRIRTVKPEFWQDEEISDLPAETALLAIGLLNYADDEGYFKFHAKLIESSVFPLRELSLSIHGMLTELSNMGYITLHEGSDGKKYGHIVNFLKHQRVNRPAPSKIAPILCKTLESEDSVSPHGQFSESSLTERNREQGKEQGTGNMISCPATPSAVSPSADDSEEDDLPDEFFQTKKTTSAELLDFIWKSVPQISRTRSSQVKLASEWKRIKAKERPSLSLLTEALEAWNASSKWEEGYAEGVHLWVRNRQWQNLPTALPDKNREPDLGGRTMSVTKVCDLPETQNEQEEIPL